MPKGTTTPTRIVEDVATVAAAVAHEEDRTIAEQINHWARLGMQVERSASLANRRVRAAAAGTGQFSALSPDERVAAHALIDTGIAERAAKQRFGRDLRAAGHSTVSLDDDGNVVEIAPDGTRTKLC
ncbi:MAG: ParD-like family protein [Acidimicrobiia bacterium]|nr:ParD-like family protein [Acidimicrobiia bacterium]